MTTSTYTQRINCRTGAALVEFSLVLPLLLLIFSAVIEICRLLLLQQTADTAAYEGARHAMVSGASAEEAINEARKLLEQSNLVQTTVTVTPEVITEETAAISVTVGIPLADNCWFLQSFGKHNQVTSHVTLVCERTPIVQLTGLPKLKGKGAKPKKASKEDEEDDD